MKFSWLYGEPKIDACKAVGYDQWLLCLKYFIKTTAVRKIRIPAHAFPRPGAGSIQRPSVRDRLSGLRDQAWPRHGLEIHQDQLGQVARHVQGHVSHLQIGQSTLPCDQITFNTFLGWFWKMHFFVTTACFLIIPIIVFLIKLPFVSKHSSSGCAAKSGSLIFSFGPVSTDKLLKSVFRWRSYCKMTVKRKHPASNNAHLISPVFQ